MSWTRHFHNDTKKQKERQKPSLCELQPSLQCLLNTLAGLSSVTVPPDSLSCLCLAPAVYSFLPSLNRHTLKAALSGAIPFLNSRVLPQDHLRDSSYQPTAGSEIHLYRSHPRFQVFSYFGNIIWLPSYQHPVEKQPESALKHPRAIHICHSLLVFFVQPWALVIRKAMEGLEESFLDSQEDNVKVKQKRPFPEKEKAGKT